MGKAVIFVADDFGLNLEINQAIITSHVSGNLHGAALMMKQSATEDAVMLAQKNPSLQIGWHLHLNDSRPLTVSSWPWGKSPARAGWSMSLFPSARRIVREEIAQQWQLFRATGLNCAFINSHHHLHAHPFVYRILKEVVGPGFKGWIRLGGPRAFSPTLGSTLAFGLGKFFFARRRRLSAWPSPDTLWGIDRTFRMQPDEVSSAIKKLPDGLHEFLFHPRTLDCPDTRCLKDPQLDSEKDFPHDYLASTPSK